MEPLVSIIVVTYNSAKYVIDTLESAKIQSYKNIELIITDDCSTDETLYLSKDWIKNNYQRFIRTKLVTNTINTGIPANLNRGLKASQGLWIKFIAGDDILAEECITELIHFIKIQTDDIRVLASNYVIFSGKSYKSGIIRKNWNTWFCSRESSAQDQYQMLLRVNRVFASTVIIRGDLLKKVDGYDEIYKLLDDWPMWVKITGMGFKIYHIDKALVYYRFHDNNLSMGSDQNQIYHPILRISLAFREKELIHKLPFIESLGLRQELIGMKICFFLGNNRKSFFTRCIYFLFKISNPFSLYLHFLKVLGIEYKYNKYLEHMPRNQ